MAGEYQYILVGLACCYNSGVLTASLFMTLVELITITVGLRYEHESFYKNNNFSSNDVVRKYST
jgi:hypothetical protein